MQSKIVHGITPEELQEVAARAVYYSGATDEHLSKILGINRDTLHQWYKSHPDFKAAVASARDRHKTEVLEKSLIKRAQGYEVIEKETGHRGRQEVDIVKTKHVPPDTAALQFFLKLRAPDRWKDKDEDKHGELAEVYAMIINKTRSLPATRGHDKLPKTIDIEPSEKPEKQFNSLPARQIENKPPAPRTRRTTRHAAGK